MAKIIAALLDVILLVTFQPRREGACGKNVPSTENRDKAHGLLGFPYEH